jgi:acetolactate synthase-1/2/3 large subunit
MIKKNRLENVSEFLINIFEKIGIKQAFCLTGGMSMHLNNAANKSNLKIIYCNHEQAVVASAEGYSKSINYKIPGLAIVTSGPGVTNTVTSVSSAFYDSTPLIILAGQVKTSDINKYNVRSYGAQETPQLEIMNLVTKQSIRYNPNLINDATLENFIRESLTARKGPIYIEVPLDVQNLKIENFNQRIKSISQNIKNRNNYKEIKNIPESWKLKFNKAEKPIIVLGNGIKLANISTQKIKNLLNKIKIPALFTWASFDLIEYDNIYNFGCAGGLAPTHSNKILQESDCILFVGTRLDLLTTAFNPNKYGKTVNKYLIEIDSNEINKNKKNISRLKILKENLEYIYEDIANLKFINMSKNWLEVCRSYKIYDNKKEKEKMSSNNFNTYEISKLLSGNTNYDTCVCSASGNAIETFARFFRPNGKTKFIWAGHSLGSMGLGLPTAIGVAVNSKKITACIEGDGGILLNIQEFFTLKANKDIKLHIFILNNNGYKSIKNSQLKAFGQTFGSDKDNGLTEIDFKLIAKATQIKYVECKSLQVFEKEIEKNSNINQVIYDLKISDNIYRGPSVQTLFDTNGKPYTTELDDINWN